MGVLLDPKGPVSNHPTYAKNDVRCIAAVVTSPFPRAPDDFASSVQTTQDLEDNIPQNQVRWGVSLIVGAWVSQKSQAKETQLQKCRNPRPDQVAGVTARWVMSHNSRLTYTEA